MTCSWKLTRVAALLAVVAATGVLAASAFATARSEQSLPTLQRQLLAAVNAFRVAHHLSSLRASPQLARAARQHSLEMGRLGYFAHDSASGMLFWQRIRQFYGARHSTVWSVGENLLWASPTISAEKAMSAWIRSPGHLRNLLSPRWRQLGVSAVRVVQAPGVFHGRDVVILTTDFGVRGY